MAIKFFTDKIQIGDYNLFEGNGGIQFDGVARAENFLGNQRFQGTVAGFTSGGMISTPPTVLSNTIDKFPFATNTNATDHGDITVSRRLPSSPGQSSVTHGYTAGGYIDGTGDSNVIDKFAFATASNATDVGDLTNGKRASAGQSSSVSGYAAAGTGGAGSSLERFPFATNTNAVNIGTLSPSRTSHTGHSSSIHGYNSGGFDGPGGVNIIDRFPFATDSISTDYGDLTQARQTPAGTSSTDYGYTSGGTTPAGTSFNTIDKFPFATNSNASDVGDLSVARNAAGSQSSTTHGYTSGGYFQPPATFTNTIDKFPFATDSNATDVGDLTVGRSQPSSQQD